MNQTLRRHKTVEENKLVHSWEIDGGHENSNKKILILAISHVLKVLV